MPAGLTYEPIASQTLGSAASTITFNSIASSWTDIDIVINGTVTSSGAEIGLRFNGSTSPYSDTRFRGNGASASSMRDSNYSYFPLVVSPSNGTPVFCRATIFSYASASINKTVLSKSSEDRNGSGWLSSTVGIWRDTAAITSITVMLNAGNLNAGATATLYGIKNA
jgi:hypothetical protein